MSKFISLDPKAGPCLLLVCIANILLSPSSSSSSLLCKLSYWVLYLAAPLQTATTTIPAPGMVAPVLPISETQAFSQKRRRSTGEYMPSGGWFFISPSQKNAPLNIRNLVLQTLFCGNALTIMLIISDKEILVVLNLVFRALWKLAAHVIIWLQQVCRHLWVVQWLESLMGNSNMAILSLSQWVQRSFKVSCITFLSSRWRKCNSALRLPPAVPMMSQCQVLAGDGGEKSLRWEKGIPPIQSPTEVVIISSLLSSMPGWNHFILERTEKSVGWLVISGTNCQRLTER